MMEWTQLVMAAGTNEPQAFPMSQTVMLFLIIGVLFWMMIIRPQRREQAQKEKLLSALERGNRIITIGGIHGTVSAVDETNKTVTVDVGKGVRIEFSRNAISTIEKKGKKAAEAAPKESGSNDKK